ncbi:MAG: ABC transporter ATP-binding protein [Chitinophagaceae bacterium]|nr:ABC transporter ATP-binding protein [Oligoflexus sp.]
MTHAMLEIKNLKKVYDRDLFKKKQLVVNDLSCSFLEGQCTALMGHNGAGKTTTIRMIFGLITPDSGEILFQGKPLTIDDKRCFGYMPETNKLPTNLTCEEILKHHLRVFRPKHLKPSEYKQAIEEKLKEIELWEHRHKRVGKLSKGMGRRLSWAQATIHKPNLIVLDEPMSGLDPLGYKLMVQLINKLRAEKVTIILCTHELWSIEQLCDQVHIMNHGQVVYSTLKPSASETKEASHIMTISGSNAESIQELARSHSLPLWLDMQSQNHRVELSFECYSDGVKWIQACIQNGLLIVDFQKLSALSEDRLIRYFGEEKTA